MDIVLAEADVGEGHQGNCHDVHGVHDEHGVHGHNRRRSPRIRNLSQNSENKERNLQMVWQGLINPFPLWKTINEHPTIFVEFILNLH